MRASSVDAETAEIAETAETAEPTNVDA